MSEEYVSPLDKFYESLENKLDENEKFILSFLVKPNIPIGTPCHRCSAKFGQTSLSWVSCTEGEKYMMVPMCFSCAHE